MAKTGWLAAAWLVGVCAAHGQGFTYKTETHLIDQTVSVHDAEGGLMQGLTEKNFSIVEDGVPQTIRFFAHDRDLPLSLGILVDESGSQEKYVKEHEKDIEEFAREVLEPRDEAFAVCFGNHLRLVSDRTNSSAALIDGIRRFDKGDRTGQELGPMEERDLGTAIYDAVYFSVEQKLLDRPQRRKVLLLLTDGEENSSEHDLIDAITRAQDANVTIYALRYSTQESSARKRGEETPRARYGMRELEHMTAQTGGRVYDVNVVNLKKAFAEIAGELRAQYSLAYQSTNRIRDGVFRKVVVRVDVPQAVVRSRAGYTAR